MSQKFDEELISRIYKEPVELSNKVFLKNVNKSNSFSNVHITRKCNTYKISIRKRKKSDLKAFSSRLKNKSKYKEF